MPDIDLKDGRWLDLLRKITPNNITRYSGGTEYEKTCVNLQ